MFNGVATDEITLRVKTVHATVTNGILDLLPDIGRRQLRIEVIRLLNRIGQRHSCLLLGDERPPPRHIADLQVLLLHNVTHLNLLLEVARLFTLKGAPLIGERT